MIENVTLEQRGYVNAALAYQPDEVLTEQEEVHVRVLVLHKVLNDGVDGAQLVVFERCVYG